LLTEPEKKTFSKPQHKAQGNKNKKKGAKKGLNIIDSLRLLLLQA